MNYITRLSRMSHLIIVVSRREVQYFGDIPKHLLLVPFGMSMSQMRTAECGLQL